VVAETKLSALLLLPCELSGCLNFCLILGFISGFHCSYLIERSLGITHTSMWIIIQHASAKYGSKVAWDINYGNISPILLACIHIRYNLTFYRGRCVRSTEMLAALVVIFLVEWGAGWLQGENPGYWRSQSLRRWSKPSSEITFRTKMQTESNLANVVQFIYQLLRLVNVECWFVV
jgi:hypothetical protein